MAEPLNAARWLTGRPRPTASLRLYCFPHSGGSTGEYLRLLAAVPEIELRVLHLPGRGRRFDEPAILSIPALVKAILDEVQFQPPFAIFGHSLGALIGYETAVALRARGLPGPTHLIASACAAPHLPRDLAPVRHLPDSELVELFAAGDEARIQHLRAEPDLLAIMVSAYRADLHLLETYRHDQPDSQAWLQCPITAVVGSRDRIQPEQVAGWAEYTDTLHIRTIEGGHFPFRTDPNGFATEVVDALAHTDRRLAHETEPFT